MVGSNFFPSAARSAPEEYYVQIIMLLIFRKTINAETVRFAVVQLIRGAIIAVSKQYSHFVYYDF